MKLMQENPNLYMALLLNQMDISSRREAQELFLKGDSLQKIGEIFSERQLPELCLLKEKFDADKEISDCAAKKIEIILISDQEYPATLRGIADAPFALYVRGRKELLLEHCVAIVGSRHASFYGLDQARRFARVLADAGLVIVSGLARGIDQAAHESTLDTGGATIAVLGCGLDVIYPPENRRLYERIAEEGLLVSEYSLGAEPRAYHFPRRNRILAGLSQGVMVVEAHERSGSLITAYQALEQGREVFALPGPVHQLTSRGTHRLIREGAALVESPEEIIVALAENIETPQFDFCEPESNKPAVQEKMVSESTVDLNQPLLKILQKQSCDYDRLLELSGMEAHEFARMLTELEIEGQIIKNAAGYYELT